MCVLTRSAALTTQMLVCANANCSVSWYHWRCVDGNVGDDVRRCSQSSLTSQANWLCSLCRPDELVYTPPIQPPQTPLGVDPILALAPWSPSSGLGLYLTPWRSPPYAFDQRSLPPSMPSTPGLEVLASLCAAEPRVPTDPARYSISSTSSSLPSEASTSHERPRSHPSRIWEEDDEPPASASSRSGPR